MIANEIYGVAERFKPGDYARAEQVIADIERLGVRRVRTSIGLHDFDSSHGRAWYDWLLAALAGRAELLVCLSCVDGKDAEPDPARYVGFVEEVLSRFSAYIPAVELWAAPRPGDRDPRLDPAGAAFTDALAHAIDRVRDRGKRVLLATTPSHSGWLELLGASGLLREIDAIGLQAFPTEAQLGGHFWPRHADRARHVLARHGSRAEVWLTEAGFAGSEHDERRRVCAFLEALDAPVQRVYWASARAAEPEETATPECAGALADAAGRTRLLGRLLSSGGPAAVREVSSLMDHGIRRNGRGVNVITGGAGFIGTNLAARLLAEGKRVRVLDNLHRAGTETNIKWLRTQYGDHLEFVLSDIRDAAAVAEATMDAEAVFHFAAQVAVTTSLEAPVHDFEVNSRGTLNLLEALRRHPDPPPLVFTSTNKVYGGLDGIGFALDGCRHAPCDAVLARRGVDESRPLSFCSPYGCSKGAADQYVLDYARTFGLPAVVLRMSCIYGPHQFGNEDQGWVAHFVRQAALGEPITIYGDGRQVRDVLFVDDLIEALRAAMRQIDRLQGHAFNIGGGPDNALSLLELVERLTDMTGRAPSLRFEDWRASDQRWYVSDIGRFADATGWQPRVGVTEGLARLWHWVTDQVVVPATGERFPVHEGRLAP